MTHGSLFSGIGGFDLAAEWMGWENVFHCEWNEFGQKVLKHYWPNAISYENIKETDFNIHRGRIDILTGGFPCQPYSTAGKRLGKQDDRHLWPEMLRAIREIQPSWIVGENVRGLINWNGGMVFDEVQADLESEGYEVQPFLLPACGVNAPHRRDRIWFVAHSKSSASTRKPREISGKTKEENGGGVKSSPPSQQQIQLPDEPDSVRPEMETLATQKNQGSGWQNFPTVSPLHNGNDGISSRLDGITFPKWRNESIKAGGNAVVPQVVYQIFKAIDQYEKL